MFRHSTARKTTSGNHQRLEGLDKNRILEYNSNMPKKPYSRHKRSAERRQRIIQAALACFLEFGFINATVQDIRMRSGASNGSIYHHFSGKEGLAATVYVEIMKDYQKTILEGLERNPDALGGVHAIVNSHLDWVNENPDSARYLMEMRHAEFMATAEDAIAEQNQMFAKGFARWLKPNLEGGRIRRLPLDLFISLLLGPAQEYVRNWLSGQAHTELAVVKEELASAAWLIVRGKD